MRNRSKTTSKLLENLGDGNFGNFTRPVWQGNVAVNFDTATNIMKRVVRLEGR